MGIPRPRARYEQYPQRSSPAGMRQRVVIAIAAACRPQILICDEPTTALDVTIQAQILQLIRDLQKELGMSVIYITHDLGVVANVADRVAVMYAGQIVEYGTVEEIFYDAWHPYTWALLQALPQLGTKGEALPSVDGTPPNLFNEIKGDAFAPPQQACAGNRLCARASVLPGVRDPRRKDLVSGPARSQDRAAALHPEPA